MNGNTLVVIKFPDAHISTFEIESMYLKRLITNLKTYQKDVEFINSYIQEYGTVSNVIPLPLNDGFIAIDMINDIILDSQGVTGVNKMTPTEIKMSKKGSVPDETKSNSTLARFIALSEAGYLKGFEEWNDNGHHLNTKICTLSIDELIEVVMNTSAYGQFVFNTYPFKIEVYSEFDDADQRHLFDRLKEFGLIDEKYFNVWQQHITKLRK